jgi:putative DNA primase/helicase
VLLGQARLAFNRDKFIALYDDGDLSYHDGDASRADAALCQMLAFWTQGRATQMDRLFRASRLMRDK